MDVNFDRLNHLLIPKTHEDRERFRRSRLGRWIRPGRWLFDALSEEGRALTVVFLFVGAIGLETSATTIYVLWSAGVGLMIAALLVGRGFALRDVESRVSTAPRVSVGSPQSFAIELSNQGQRAHSNLRVRRPFLPWDGEWHESRPALGRLEPGETAIVETSATFIERGEHWLDPFHAVAVAPLGLSVGRGVRTAGCRFLVVPRLANVVAVDLPATQRHQPGGVPQASRTGEAMELFGVRPYRAGDAVRDLHIRTWARLGVPHVKEYQQEYFTRIGVVLDTDASRSTERQFEAAISLTAGVVDCLARGDALVDVLVMGGEVHALTLGRSLGHFEQALDLLAAARPSGPLSADAILANLAPYLERLSAVVVVAQAWDEERRLLQEGIERSGVQCRLVRVVPAEATRRPPEVLDVTIAQIEEGEGLRL